MVTRVHMYGKPGLAWPLGKLGHPFPDQIMHTTCFYTGFCSPVYRIDVERMS